MQDLLPREIIQFRKKSIQETQVTGICSIKLSLEYQGNEGQESHDGWV
jgi:hypothetical protein